VPTLSTAVVNGDEQAAKAAASTRHWNPDAPPDPLNVNVGVVSLVAVGPPVMSVFGVVVSTTNVCVAGVASVFPAASVARTSKVWLPSFRTAVVNGEAHVANAAPSTRHWNVDPGSVAVNVNVGVLSLPGLSAPAVIVVFGAVVSIVKVWDAGVASTLPAASIARTSKAWMPSARAAVVSGDVQAANTAPSTRHWKLAPASLVKLKVGVVSLVGVGNEERRVGKDL
jgi:hypothetical protein